MSRSRHEAPFERHETAVHGGRARRRADLEEQLATAIAANDAGRVAELRGVLADEADEVVGRGRRADW
jgi:hypothetical protein